MADYDIVLVSHAERLATITLNRPEKRNAMNGLLVRELLSVLQTLGEDNTIEVVILKANGEHFCAGADIGWMQEIAKASSIDNYKDAFELANLMQAISTFSKPIITLVQGATLGGGLGLIAASDIVIAANNASFTFSEVKIGIVPSIVSPYVVAAMGQRLANYFFLTAEKFDAAEAHRSGLVHQIVEAQALEETGLNIANTILKNSPSAIKEAKKLIKQVNGQPLSSSLVEFTAKHLAEMRTSADGVEGLKAFIEKRSPLWNR